MDGLSDLVAGLRLGWRLRRGTADVAFVHCPECLWGIRLLRRRAGGPPLVAVWHGVGPTQILSLRRPGHPLARALAWMRTAGERRALAADGHVAVHGAARARTPFPVRPQPPGHRDPERRGPGDLPPGRRSPARAATAGGHGSMPSGPAQMGYRKGLDVALAAVAEARRDLPGLRLAVVGVPPGKAADGVDWLGVIPQALMAEVYGHADLLLFPTRYESFGLVVIEAMAAGLPVIVSDAIGAGIVTDGRNGVVVCGHDPSRYAEALRRLADPAVRAAMAAANQEDARRFSIESAGAGYAAVAESIAGG